MKFRDLSGRWVDIPAQKGDPGFTPTITVKQNTSSIYKLEITTEDGVIVTPNLRGNNDGGIDATIVDELPTGEDINPNLIYLTLIVGDTYLANMFRDGKWINFGGATTTVVQQVINDPAFVNKVEEIVDDKVEEISNDSIRGLFS